MAGPERTTIGDRYELQRPLGSGGMAEVWLATDRRLNGKLVAVKRLHGFRIGAPNAAADLERARREAFAASRLSHPNLVAVTDFIAEHGEPFIVMEYVEGATLDDLCHGAGLPVEQAAQLIGQVAAALGEAHAAHIVHRDIKPANIIVTPRGDAKLADFGIARSPDDPRYTKTGMFTGTMRYLAPEVLDGSAADPAADVWALGATLYEAIEGRPAFEAPTNVALIAAIAMGPIPPVTRSPEIAELVARMLERDPARRPVAGEVASRLRQISLGAAAVATTPWIAGPAAPDAGVRPSDATVRVAPRSPGPPPGPPGPPRPPARPRSRPKKRTRAWMLVAVPVVVAGVASGIVLGTGGGGNEPVAGGNNNSPTAGHSRSSTTGAEPTHQTSSAQIGGHGPPGTGSPGEARLAGVTIRHARELGREPVVTTEGAAPTTLRVKDLVTGKGAAAGPHSTVTVLYVSAVYRHSKVFDSSWSRGAEADTLALDSTLPGFARGIGGGGPIDPMRVGGRRVIVVPPELAYGDQRNGPIPPNSTLVFVVDLKSVR